MLRKCLSIIFKLSLAIGFILIACTAGSSDLEVISIESLVIRTSIGVLLMTFGFIGLKLSAVEYVI